MSEPIATTFYAETANALEAELEAAREREKDVIDIYTKRIQRLEAALREAGDTLENISMDCNSRYASLAADRVHTALSTEREG